MTTDLANIDQDFYSTKCGVSGSKLLNCDLHGKEPDDLGILTQ